MGHQNKNQHKARHGGYYSKPSKSQVQAQLEFYNLKPEPKFIVIDSNSIRLDLYFKEDGTTTQNKKEAMVVSSIEEGQEKCRFMTLYQPLYEEI